MAQVERRVVEDDGIRDFKIKIENVSPTETLSHPRWWQYFPLGTLRTRDPSPGEHWEVGRW